MNVAFGMPCYRGRVEVPCALSVLRACLALDDMGVRNELIVVSDDALIPRARDAIVHTFLCGNATHLVFVDSDVSFEPEALLRLLGADVPIVAGVYPARAFNAGKLTERIRAGADFAASAGATATYAVRLDGAQVGFSPSGFMRCAAVAAGFLCVRRDAFERMTVHCDTYEGRRHFFPTYVDDAGRFVSEDYGFCRKAHDAGLDTYADVVSALGHTGKWTWRGRFADQLDGSVRALMGL